MIWLVLFGLLGCLAIGLCWVVGVVCSHCGCAVCVRVCRFVLSFDVYMCITRIGMTSGMSGWRKRESLR